MDCIGTVLSCNLPGKTSIADSILSLKQMVMVVKEQLAVSPSHRHGLQGYTKLLIARDLPATGA